MSVCTFDGIFFLTAQRAKNSLEPCLISFVVLQFFWNCVETAAFFEAESVEYCFKYRSCLALFFKFVFKQQLFDFLTTTGHIPRQLGQNAVTYM